VQEAPVKLRRIRRRVDNENIGLLLADRVEPVGAVEQDKRPIAFRGQGFIGEARRGQIVVDDPD